MTSTNPATVFLEEFEKAAQLARCMAAYARIKNCTIEDAGNHVEAVQKAREKVAVTELRGHDPELDRAIDMSMDPRMKRVLQDDIARKKT